MPSRRWPGSMSRARPTDRAVEPAPRAAISQVARAARPPAEAATATAEGEVRAAGLAAGRDPDLAWDLADAFAGDFAADPAAGFPARGGGLGCLGSRP